MTPKEYNIVLRLLFNDKDSFEISPEDCKTLCIISTGSIYVQTEDISSIEDATVEHSLKMWKVWRRDAWELLWSTYKQKKVDSELGRQRFNIQKLQRDKIANAIVEKNNGFIPMSLSVGLAQIIWEGAQKEIAKSYGIKIEEIIWPDQMEEHVKSLVPELKRENIL